MAPVTMTQRPAPQQPTGVLHDTAPPTSVEKPSAARRRLLLERPIVSTVLGPAAPNVLAKVIRIAVTAIVDAHFVGWFLLRQWLARSRRQQELSTLSDHLLRDINVSSFEAGRTGREKARSFWPPVH